MTVDSSSLPLADWYFSVSSTEGLFCAKEMDQKRVAYKFRTEKGQNANLEKHNAGPYADTR